MTAPIDPAEFGIKDWRGVAEESLHRIVLLDEQIKAMTEERAALRDAVKLELSNDGTPIIDGERGLVATLKERNKPASIDLINMAKHPEMEEHIIEAARTGILNASITPLRAMKGKAAWADALLGMEMPGGVNSVLIIQDTTKGS